MDKKTAIIIGAGPAGLTAAYKLLKETDIKPIILEESEYIGGISRTARYNGNRMDLGGHRFFSKNEEVNELWRELIEGSRLYLEDSVVVFNIGDATENLDLVVGGIPIDAILEYSVKHLLGERTYSAGSVL